MLLGADFSLLSGGIAATGNSQNMSKNEKKEKKTEKGGPLFHRRAGGARRGDDARKDVLRDGGARPRGQHPGREPPPSSVARHAHRHAHPHRARRGQLCRFARHGLQDPHAQCGSLRRRGRTFPLREVVRKETAPQPHGRRHRARDHPRHRACGRAVRRASHVPLRLDLPRRSEILHRLQPGAGRVPPRRVPALHRRDHRDARHPPRVHVPRRRAQDHHLL